MQSFTDGDIEVKVFAKKGIVLSSQVKSETHVSSSGGGGQLTNGTGYVSAPQIKSTVHKEQEIWIKTPKGVDECIRLKETELPVIQGQKVTFLLVGKPTETTGWYAILINHDAFKWWINSGGDAADLLELIPLSYNDGRF